MSGPAKRTTDLVDARDGFCCVRCGRSLEVSAGSRHHRKLRRAGDHSVENLVLLCGSGVTLCHGWVHAHPAQARAEGFIIPVNRRPDLVVSEVPVRSFADGWVLLDREGGLQRIVAADAYALLEVFGMLPKLEVGA